MYLIVIWRLAYKFIIYFWSSLVIACSAILYSLNASSYAEFKKFRFAVKLCGKKARNNTNVIVC